MWKGVAIFLKLFPNHGTALAHGQKSHSFLKCRRVKNSILNSVSPNSLSTQEELHPTPAAQNIKSKIWSIRNMQVHPLGIWPQGGPWLWYGRRLTLVSQSCQIIFHKLCLPHSKLFLKSTSICFLGTQSYFSSPREVWLFFWVVSGTALDIKYLNLKISPCISKKNVRTLILSHNAYYRYATGKNLDL